MTEDKDKGTVHFLRLTSETIESLKDFRLQYKDKYKALFVDEEITKLGMVEFAKRYSVEKE